MADKKTGGLADIVRRAGQTVKAASGKEALATSRPKIFSILDYIESSWGLAMKLYPTQRFIVKLYYHLELDDKLPEDPLKQIQIINPFTGEIEHRFSEKAYLRYLYDNGRCNIGEQDHERRELVLAIGRRAGKTTLSGIFASYEIYRLLNLYNPQQYFGFPNGYVIQIISIATGKKQASLLFNEVTSHLNKCSYFSAFKASDRADGVSLRTPYDIATFGPSDRHNNGKFTSYNGKATIQVTFSPCNAKSLRGPGNFVIILDEVAHFLDEGGSSAEEVYDAVTPSAAAYSRKDPDTGRPAKDDDGNQAPVESRIILISSPLGKNGLFFDKFDLAMRGGKGSENILAIQAPTWETNPTVPIKYYEEKYHENPTTFMVEFGANFSDQVKGWIERESDLMACIDPARRPIFQGRPRSPHQMGVDIGLVGDMTAIFITHVEDGRVVLDYHEVWQAKTDWFELNPHLEGPSTPYARTLKTVERLDFDEIAEWIQVLCRRFYVTAGIFDQWNGIPLEQSLHKKGLKPFRSEHFTRDVSSKMYQNAKMFLYDERLALYDYPVPKEGGSKHSPFIRELLTLEAKQITKNVVLVQAPQGKQAFHDDMSDAFVRAVWLSTELMMNTKHVARGGQTSHGPTVAPSLTPARYQLMRARKHGVGDRVAPGKLGRSLVRSR